MLAARRTLLLGSAPSWVPRISGIPPDVYLNFLLNIAYLVGVGVRPASAFVGMTNSAGLVQDAGGGWHSVLANTPRINSLGLLSEQAKWNYVPNNTMAGGSAGVAPTGWSAGSLTGVTVAISAPEIINGLYTVTFNYQTGSGFAGGNVFPGLTGSAIAVSSGQGYTLSAFLAATGISAGLQIYLLCNYNVSGNLATSNLAPSLTAALAPFNVSGTVGGSNTSLSLPLFNIYLPAGANNFSLTVGMPQLEDDVNGTSPIATSAGAVQRIADVGLLLPQLAFTPTFSVYGSGTPNDPTSYPTQTQTPLQLDIGNNVTRADLDRASDNGFFGGGVTVGGNAQSGPGQLGAWNQGVFGKFAQSIGPNSWAEAFNGSSASSAGNESFTPSRVDIGWGSNGDHQFDGYLAELAIWPRDIFPAAALAVLA